MRLILDAHVPLPVAKGLRQDGVDAITLQDWLGGAYRHAPDDEILMAAFPEQRVLATYDCRTIPPLLRRWAEDGQHHAGVILIDEQTIPSRDIGGLRRALRLFIARTAHDDWQDCVLYLETERED